MGPWSWPHPGASFNGIGYSAAEMLKLSMGGARAEEIPADFGGYVQALMQCPPAFAAQLKRARYLSQARFQWRNKKTGKQFGTSGLGIVERPWPKATTGTLLSRMEWHAGPAGNAFVFYDQVRGRLKVMRPDFITMVLGSQTDAKDPADQLDAEIVAFAYTPGGLGSGQKPTILNPADVAHWAPIPDPLTSFRGMSWLTPLVRELQGDILTADHKIRYFENGATPNLVVKGIPAGNATEFKALVDMMEDEHSGASNAYKTLYLAAGADATVVGSDMSQLAFKDLVGAGETRIASVGEVPAVMLGISEGMQGSSLNQGNYKEARRSFNDGWFASTLGDLAACLDEIIPSPTDGELSPDTSRMPLMREDERDAAEIRKADAQTVRNLLDAGFDPNAAIDFVQTGDLSTLTDNHSGLFSVQLQKPGTKVNNPPKEGDDDDADPDA